MRITYTKHVILKSPWHRELCEAGKPHFQQIIANRTGIAKSNISATLNGSIISKAVQERISDEVGIPVGKLFGDNAWFRRAAKRLRQFESRNLGANTN